MSTTTSGRTQTVPSGVDLGHVVGERAPLRQQRPEHAEQPLALLARDAAADPAPVDQPVLGGLADEHRTDPRGAVGLVTPAPDDVRPDVAVRELQPVRRPASRVVERRRASC